MLRYLALAAVVAVIGFGVVTLEKKEPTRPNVVLIVIDALRRDHLSAFGYERATSPNLDRLAAQGALFTRMSSVSAQTAPAVASLFSGLYPSESGVHFFHDDLSFGGGRKRPYLDESLTLFAESMRASGYATMAVVANPWISEKNGFAQGFDAFEEVKCARPKRNDGATCRAEEMFARASRLLAERPARPFFLYVHLMDVHNPYIKDGITTEMFVECKGKDRYRNGPPRRKLRDCDQQYMVALYDEGIVRVDAAIAEFRSELSRFSAPQDTLLAITADHGDEFGEHGGLGHGTTLFDELVASFLILHWPGTLAPERIEARTSLVDVRPIVESLADPRGPRVRDLLRSSRSKGGDVYLELGEKKGLVREDWKFVVADHEEEMLYDLSGDPLEHENRLDEQGALASELKAHLQAFVEAAEPPKGPENVAPIDPARLERLRALGYVESSDSD